MHVVLSHHSQKKKTHRVYLRFIGDMTFLKYVCMTNKTEIIITIMLIKKSNDLIAWEFLYVIIVILLKNDNRR